MTPLKNLRKSFAGIFEGYLSTRVKKLTKKPQHVAIIMDGNGRWASKRGLPRIEGHREATKAVRKTIEGCIQFSIPHLSLFAFSTENWNRPIEEVNALMKLFLDQINANLDELDSQGVRIRLVGQKENIFKETLKAFDYAESRTAENDRLNLYLLINYSGRTEIINAIKKIMSEIQNKNKKEILMEEEIFANYLYVPEAPFPDLIIRTSGEKRISNFYLWQAAYSELYFDPVLWPDYDIRNLYKALQDYSARKRRYGGLEEF